MTRPSTPLPYDDGVSEIWYTARRRFGPERDDWQGFVRWSGLVGVDDLVTLDTGLCPELIDTLTREDWEHNVQQDYRVFLFRDLDYLRGRIGARSEIDESVNLLALLLEPTSTAEVERRGAELAGGGFVFRGFELLDVHGDVSALSNCGGFPKAFEPAELNRFGLLDASTRAREVRADLARYYPDQPHAVCDLWAVWRWERAAGDETT